MFLEFSRPKWPVKLKVIPLSCWWSNGSSTTKSLCASLYNSCSFTTTPFHSDVSLSFFAERLSTEHNVVQTLAGCYYGRNLDFSRQTRLYQSQAVHTVVVGIKDGSAELVYRGCFLPPWRLASFAFASTSCRTSHSLANAAYVVFYWLFDNEVTVRVVAQRDVGRLLIWS
jgi:hypothetical protein